MEKILVIGPGAIGGAVAGAILESGHPVSIAARTPFDELEVIYPDGRIQTKVECIEDPRDAGHAEFVLLGVKAHQTEAVADWLRASVGDDSTLVVLQNGVEHIERVRPMCLMAHRSSQPSWPCRQGVTDQVEFALVRAGSLTVPEGTGARRLAELIDSPFLRVRVTDDWLTAAWQKLLLNAASGGIGTLARRGSILFREDPDARKLALSVMREIAAVARAEGAKIEDRDAEALLDRLVSRAGTHLSSIVTDRVGGNPTEWDARNAVVERIAKRHGIEVPLNRALTTLIRVGEPEAE